MGKEEAFKLINEVIIGIQRTANDNDNITLTHSFGFVTYADLKNAIHIIYDKEENNG